MPIHLNGFLIDSEIEMLDERGGRNHTNLMNTSQLIIDEIKMN